MYELCVVDDFYQHIKLYSYVLPLDLLATILLIHVHVMVCVAEDCRQLIKCYNKAKKISKDLNQKSLHI